MSDFDAYIAKCRAEARKAKPLTRAEREAAYAVMTLWFVLVALVVFVPK